jgi:hypothetical protein
MSSDEESNASSSEVEEKEEKKKRGPKKGSKKGGEKKAKKEKKTPKKKKDPNAPKRPLSAFMFYSQKQRPIVKKDNPSANFAGVAKILGEQWKALDESEKKEYDASAVADKARFEKEKAAYDKTKGSAKKEEDDDDEEDDE